MLPDRSKRYAGLDKEPPRLKLVNNWQLVLVALLTVGLLRAIFPQKALVEKLYDQEQLDELTLSYIENLHRTEPNNADLTILLGRTRREQLDVAGLERLLDPILQSGDARQRSEARMLLLDSYERAMTKTASGSEQQLWQNRLADLLRLASEDEMPPQLAGAFAATAFRLGLTQTGLLFLRRISQEQPITALVVYARTALAQGRYTLAAEYFLLARQQAGDRDLARVYFHQGIAALMAASRFQQAMDAVDRNLGDLADDPETLRFLARTALAAGEPRRAARYAQELVFTDRPATAGALP
jgi:polysaccharide biosynthesis protein PelB